MKEVRIMAWFVVLVLFILTAISMKRCQKHFDENPLVYLPEGNKWKN